MKKMWLKASAGAVLVLALLLGVGCGTVEKGASSDTAPDSSASEEAVKTGPFKGMVAPDFTLKDLDGTEWTLSQLKGNSVALVFFTSW